MRTSTALLLLVLLLIIVAGAALIGARRLQLAPDMSRLGHLAYVAEDGLYVADWDGRDPQRIVSTSQLPGHIPEGCREFWGGPTWSPDGRYLAVRTLWNDRCDGSILITDAVGSSSTTIQASGWEISWAPDSSRIVTWVATWETIGIYGIDGERQALLQAPQDLMSLGDYTPTWTPDGGAALVPHGVVVPLDGTAPYVDPRLTYTSRSLVSPDRTTIAYGQRESIILAATDGTSRRVLDSVAPSAIGGGVLWSPTGDRIAFQLVDTGAGIVDVATGATTSLGLPNSEFDVIRFSPEGDRLLLSTFDAADRSSSLWSVQADGSGARELVEGTAGGDWQWLQTTPAPTADPTPAPTAETTPPPSPASSPLASRIGGEVIVFGRRETGPGWDLVAQDPETGDVRTIVDTDGIVACPDASGCLNYVRRAEWSPDGRSVAFQVSNEDLDGPTMGPCGPMIGIWVASASDGPRQLTTPCDPAPGVEEMWAWSPDSARLALTSGSSDDLFVVDPSDGSRMVLATDVRGLTALAWSPDGTRIAFADRSSVYVITADVGRQATFADPFSDIVNIAWSPDGSKLLIHDQGRYRIQVMNVDGSDLRVLLEGEDACCSTAWSPTGDRILYMLSVGRAAEPSSGSFDSQVWTVAPDGSDARIVFDSAGCDLGDMGAAGDSLPIWAPGGTQVAYSDCGVWVTKNADGSGEPRPIGGERNRPVGPPLLHRSWSGGGLSVWDLELIGQRDG